MKIFFHAEKIFWRFCDEFFFFYFSTSHVILTRVYIFRYFFFLYLPEIIHSFLCVFKKIINEFSWKSFTPKTTLSTTKIKFLQWLNSRICKSFENKIKFIYSPRYITLLNTLVMICSSGFNVSPSWNREKKNRFLLSIDVLNIKIRKRERERDKCCTLSFILYPNTFFIDFPWNGSLDAAKCTA